MTNGLRQLPQELNADGNAVINTLQQLAGAIGTSVVTTIVAASRPLFRATRHLPHNREAKMPSVFWLLSLS